MAKTTTAVNYTTEQEAELKAGYNPDGTQGERDAQVEELVKVSGRTIGSIRMKLTAMGVYVKKGKVTKSGEKVTRKEDLVSEIATATGKDEHFFRTAINLNKDVLQFILAMALRDAEALAEELAEELEDAELDAEVDSVMAELEAEELALDTMHS